MIYRQRAYRGSGHLPDRGWWSETGRAAPGQLFSCEQSWRQALCLRDVSLELMNESLQLMNEAKESCSQTAQARVTSTEALAQFWVARGREQ